jgi:uncharacterized protein YbbK (DUF523 family)
MIRTSLPLAGKSIKLAVSSCLLGMKVRYDGSDKFNTLIVNELGRIYDLVPVCPEVAIGLDVPRPPIKLLNGPGGMHAVGRDNPQIDVTASLTDFGKEVVDSLNGICGFILQSRSPSCGVDSTEIIQPDGQVVIGSGLFAQTLREMSPTLPLISEQQLSIPEKRKNFLARVDVFHQRQV